MAARKGMRKVMIAEIIRYTQPDIFELLLREELERNLKRYVIQPTFPEDDYEFRETKYLMEERKGVHL